MVYVLTREGPADDPRIREIHTPEEVVHPTWEAGTWTARCSTGSAANVLASRRYGFALIETQMTEADRPAPTFRHRTPIPRASVASLAAAGFHVHDGEPRLSGPLADWERWRSRKRRPPKPLDRGNLQKRLQGKVENDTLVRAGDAARAGTWLDPQGEDVAIVKVFHGWGVREQRAVEYALDAAAALGPKARVVVVQNDEEAYVPTLAWVPRANADRYTAITVQNDGFAAACNAGAKVARKSRWLLFTQPDAMWGPDAVRDAIGLSLALQAPPAGFGAPAIVGPSGGYVDDLARGGIREFGRNVAQHRGQPPTPVDWIAGYWLLVDGATFRKAGGWDERFFLYYEDPDLSLRCALAGARPVAWPGLAVEHERGGTIRARLPDRVVVEMQGESRATFSARWGGR